MYGLAIFGAALFSGPILGRFSYLIFTDVRMSLPWLLGGSEEDSRGEQIRVLTATMVATILDSMWAVFSGYSATGALIVTPFLFVWIWEGLYTVQRLFGPVIERFVVDLDPVKIAYSIVKKVGIRMWKKVRNRNLIIEGDFVRLEPDASEGDGNH